MAEFKYLETGVTKRNYIHGELSNAYKILVEKPEGKRLLRARQRSEDNIKMDFRK
jgi:hypothetical protein